MKIFLVIGYLYCKDDPERDISYPLGTASSKEKANALIEEWVDLIVSEEDGYVDFEEVEPQYDVDKSYKAIDEFDDRWAIDVIILETELDKML